MSQSNVNISSCCISYLGFDQALILDALGILHIFHFLLWKKYLRLKPSPITRADIWQKITLTMSTILWMFGGKV